MGRLSGNHWQYVDAVNARPVIGVFSASLFKALRASLARQVSLLTAEQSGGKRGYCLNKLCWQFYAFSLDTLIAGLSLRGPQLYSAC